MFLDIAFVYSISTVNFVAVYSTDIVLFLLIVLMETEKRPVIIHRAILGSVERLMAVITESYGGKW